MLGFGRYLTVFVPMGATDIATPRGAERSPRPVREALVERFQP
jgi:hypothetical protein